MSKVLCTNGLLSKSLSVVRSLGARGVQVITSDKTLWHMSRFSKFTAQNLRYPDPKRSPDHFLEWLISTIRKEHIDMIFPMDDDTMEIAVAHREELEPIVRMVVPSKHAYDIASDKGKTVQLAVKHGVLCPTTIELSEDVYRTDLIAKIKNIQFPLVIKPRRSSGARGIRIVESLEQLKQMLPIIHKDYPDPILQECIPPGVKYDVCLAYNCRHELVASFVQKQIRNYPIRMGPSTVHESVFYPELIEIADHLMKGLHWHGVVDVEFMVDPRDGRPKLMEINPRFWSSLHLSVRCGVDFPWLLYGMATNRPVSKSMEYVAGKMGRSLFPGDVLHFLSNPDRLYMKPPIWTTALPDDIVTREDPLPTLGFILSVIRHSLDLKTWKLLVRR